MKNLLTLIVLIILCSCSVLDRDHDLSIKITEMPVSKIQAPRLTRSEKYKACILELNRDGIKQSLIQSLCDGAYGSL